MLRFTHWFCPKRERNCTAIILIFSLIWSRTDNSTRTVKVNSKVFTTRATKENTFLLGRSLCGMMLTSVLIVVISEEPLFRLEGEILQTPPLSLKGGCFF